MVVQSLILECCLSVGVLVLAVVALWFSKELDKSDQQRERLEFDLRTAGQNYEARGRYIKELQDENAELTTRLDEARRLAKGGEA